MPAEDLTGSSQGNIGDTFMANTVVVSKCSSTGIQQIQDTFLRQEASLSSNLEGAAPTAEKAQLDGVSAVRNSFRQFNVSPEVADILWHHGDQASKNQYKRYIDIVKGTLITVYHRSAMH